MTIKKYYKAFKGFSIIEMMVVLLFFVGLTILLASRPFSLSSEYQIVQQDAKKIKQILDTAREKAIMNEKGVNWGVYLVGSSSTYYIFAGDNFKEAIEYTPYFLDSSNIFLDPASGTVKEIVFQRYKGYATNTQIEIGLKNKNIKAKVKINYFGNIDFEIY
ncbi:MAG: pilus assembly FimT family protein [Minisyncoccia bacterium]